MRLWGISDRFRHFQSEYRSLGHARVLNDLTIVNNGSSWSGESDPMVFIVIITTGIWRKVVCHGCRREFGIMAFDISIYLDSRGHDGSDS